MEGFLHISPRVEALNREIEKINSQIISMKDSINQYEKKIVSTKEAIELCQKLLEKRKIALVEEEKNALIEKQIEDLGFLRKKRLPEIKLEETCKLDVTEYRYIKQELNTLRNNSIFENYSLRKNRPIKKTYFVNLTKSDNEEEEESGKAKDNTLLSQKLKQKSNRTSQNATRYFRQSCLNYAKRNLDAIVSITKSKRNGDTFYICKLDDDRTFNIYKKFYSGVSERAKNGQKRHIMMLELYKEVIKRARESEIESSAEIKNAIYLEECQNKFTQDSSDPSKSWNEDQPQLDINNIKSK